MSELSDSINALFQFHEGPIKTLGKSRIKLLQQRFNSMKVRLKRKCVTAVLTPLLCFNSMKVRLKLDCSGFFFSCPVFQFHEGPIKTITVQDVLDVIKSVSIP